MAKKNGYHGGLTPQEMVLPITVLAAGDLRLAGWAEVSDPTPEWWEASPTVPAAVATVLPVKPPEPTTPSPSELLWDAVESAPTPEVHEKRAPLPDWLAALLASPVFLEQKKLGGRAVPPDEVFGSLLASRDGSGGKLTAAALARKLDLPVFRLRGLLAVAQRVLNVDGFAALSRDEQSDTVAFDRGLLLRQFDLLAEDRP